ncbi:MAG: TetR/AcrR family transcriptional regulator [Deltaproteobacteria bacterium]|nr:TetR/AcrR family transcriptional regulator [Candidatus Zymogenaceae bacterium]
MAQMLKEDIKRKIDDAALKTFYEMGYQGAVMADIARHAGVSVGNIYRYYKNKKELFNTLVPMDIIDGLRDMIGSKFMIADGMDLKNARHAPAMDLMDEQLFEYLVTYRRQIVITMEEREGNPYLGFKDELVDLMTNMAMRYTNTIEHPIHVDELKLRMLRLIYENLYNAVVEILKSYTRADQIRAAFDNLLDYHFFGVSRFLW